MAYWSPEKINKVNAQYNFVLGGRSTGKTYALIK
jgi:hypothetical protein